MKMSVTLSIDYPRQLELPLFRAAMQLIVAVEQGYSIEVIPHYIRNLRRELYAIDLRNVEAVE